MNSEMFAAQTAATWFGSIAQLLAAAIIFFQLREIRKQLTVQAIVAMQQSLLDLNKCTESDHELCTMRYNHFYTIQTLRDMSLLGDSQWFAEREYIKDALMKDGMIDVWMKSRRMYGPTLRATIEEIIHELHPNKFKFTAF